MSQTEKAEYFRQLKEAGVTFDRHYREYSTSELKAALDELQATQPELFPQPEPAFDPAAMREAYDRMHDDTPAAPQPSPQAAPPLRPKDESELPGVRQAEDLAPIRTDEQGRVWLQEEVRKPASPRPRGRRVLRYDSPGVKEVTVKNGDYTETFEIAGSEQMQSVEVKITLPSYQVGIYKDPRFPFKVYIYNEVTGFDFDEVNQYYGGAERVPAEIKRMYVENVLCYDIRTVVRAIEAEYRQLQLLGKV